MSQRNELFKGSLSTIVLKLLSEEDRMYGYEITKKVRELSDGHFKITEGALYPTLHKLEAEGMLVATIEMQGNRARKYYSLTKAGKKDAKLRLENLAEFVSKMQQLLNVRLIKN